MSPAGGGGWGVEEWMKRICLCFTPSRIALAEGARETVSLRGTLSTLFFFLKRHCTTFTLQDFYIESVTAHRIKINYHSCFHNSWPNSKTKLKLKHLWSKGPPGVSGALCSLRILRIGRIGSVCNFTCWVTNPTYVLSNMYPVLVCQFGYF